MNDVDIPFTDEELTLAESVATTADLLLQAQRIGTQAFHEFGYMVMEPVIRGQIGLSDRETAIGTCFFRLLAAVGTLSDLRQPYHFQAVAATTRLVSELSVDIHLLALNKIPDAVEKFHGFTRAARFSSAYKTVQFYEKYPELEVPGDTQPRRALVETPGKQQEIEALCLKLWRTHKAPEHWSGLRWLEQARCLGPEFEERYHKWSSVLAWLIHGGGAGVGGLDAGSFQSIEVLCRDTVKEWLPEAYRLVAVEMHIHKAVPKFFEQFDRVKSKVEVFAMIDAKLQTCGRKSKLSQ